MFYVRYLWWMKILRRLRVHAELAGVDGHQHNVRGILDGRPSDRILKLVMPLSVIQGMDERSRVLAIGCRFETDLLYLAAYGFDPDNVRGMDMLSYSPWVDLGNMHAMPYADSSWDAVLMGWVLTYSNDPPRAAREVVRVLKPGGIVAIGITSYPQATLDELKEKSGSIIGTTAEIGSVEDILRVFGGHVDQVYFRHDRRHADRQGPCLVIFSVRK